MSKFILIILTLTLYSCSEKHRFELLDSDHTRVKFVNRIIDTDSLHVMNFEYIYNGAGVGIADLNNDGRQDIVLTGNQEAPRIYLNEGNFRFSDISSSFEDLDQGQWYSGVTFADINKDGWMDVYLTCTAYDEPEKRKNRLYINQGLQNDGQLVFKDMAESYGIADDSYSVHAAFFDYDRDGDLDLSLLNNYDNDRLSASYRPKIMDGTAPSNDDLYRNNGDGTFSNVTKESGIICEGFGLGLALGDVNKDGYPDIYVSNDYISNDLLYINQGDGTFQNRIDKYLSYQTKSSMGNDMADINNDGFPDIFTLDMMPENYFRKKQTIGGFGYIFYINDAKYGYEHQYLRNMLHLHNGFINGEMLPYSEVGQMMGIYQTEWSWSPLFADYDNEGDLNFVKRNQEWFDETPSYSYGAKVELWCKGNYQFQEHFLSRGYASSVDPVVHFGLSAYLMVDSLRVTWPAGDHISYLRNIEANQLVEIDERDAIPSHMDSQSQEDTEYPFSRLEGVISYDHQQDDFIDFFYSQSIIPHKFSQIGPCMQKGDLNNDGLEDIIVGATNTLPTRVFLRDGNKFVETEIEGLTT